MEILTTKITDNDDKLVIVQKNLAPLAEIYNISYHEKFGIQIKSGNYYFTFGVKNIFEIVDNGVSITVRSTTYSLIFYKEINHFVPIIF